MRYQNWDVLLFPGGSRIPIQEFDTKYHVLSQRIDSLPYNASFENDVYSNTFESVNQVPMLTSFIPSLDAGTPFRVSIHSWETPKASQILSSIMVQDESVLYEARVYIDGILIAQKTFNEHAVWPEVVEYSTMTDSKANGKPLRFPKFHSEILDQAHWEATEPYGRIGIVIGEGVTDNSRSNNKQITNFDRLRDQVSFAFQHAPKHILEYSNIAWPNARMLHREPRPDKHSGTLASRLALAPKPDFQAHAHSPQRDLNAKSKAALTQPNNDPYARGFRRSYVDQSSQRNSTVSALSAYDDPFIGPTPVTLRTRSQQVRKSSTDDSMPDCASDKTAQSHESTEMSGVAYQKVDFLKHMNEAAITEIVRALSPDKRMELANTLSPPKPSQSGPTTLQAVSVCHGPSEPSGSDLPPSRSVAIAGVSDGDIFQRYLRSRVLSDGGASSKAFHLSNSTSTVAADSGVLGPSCVMPASVDSPSLPGAWQGSDNALHKVYTARTPTLSDVLRSRSSSNVSKRKRLDSPAGRDISNDSATMPSTSTSPSKQDENAHEANDASPTDGEIPLSASKWAKQR